MSYDEAKKLLGRRILKDQDIKLKNGKCDKFSIIIDGDKNAEDPLRLIAQIVRENKMAGNLIRKYVQTIETIEFRKQQQQKYKPEMRFVLDGEIQKLENEKRELEALVNG